MKSAKEWAAEVVRQPDESRGFRMDAAIEDAADGVYIVAQSNEPESSVVTAARGRGIITRLVEHVQADARAPLEEEIARLRAENERLNAEHVEYRAFIADANDMLAEEHEQARRLGE